MYFILHALKLAKGFIGFPEIFSHSSKYIQGKNYITCVQCSFFWRVNIAGPKTMII
jgi:hypothetical protein